MKLCSIASGSSGNCIFIGTENTNLLVDVGISGKRIEQGLASIEIDASNMHGILITHEHIDHINGLGVMARRYHLPIYSTAETINAIMHTKSVGRIPEELLQIIEPDCSFQIGDIRINPFSILHDASNPVAYTFEKDETKIGIATDLGTYNDYIINHLKKCSAILIEANHDIHMLQVGSYPYVLKKRILGDRGHLSNDNCGRLLCEIFHEGLKHISLGHLSKENNYPDLAYETVKYELQQYNQEILKQCNLIVAKRESPSELIVV